MRFVQLLEHAALTWDSLLPNVRPIGPSRSPKPPNLPALLIFDPLEALACTDCRARTGRSALPDQTVCGKDLLE